MTALINSGILYLEKFIEDSNLLPSDLTRLLNFIRALDEKLLDTRAEADERLKTLAAAQRIGAQRPEEVNEQRMIIDSLHTQMIHLQEEKNLTAMQLEALLRRKEEELAQSEAALKRELSINDTEHHYAHLPQQFAVGMHPQQSQGMYQAVPGSRQGAAHAMHPMEYGQRKSSALQTSSMQMSMGGRHHSHHSLPTHHQQQIPGAMPIAQPVMGPYVVNGGQVGPPMFYPGMPQHMEGAEVQDPALTFVPVDPSMSSSSSRPQAKNGRYLTSAEISLDLQGKQAELLWPDDGMWYLVVIRTVDMVNRTADIQYHTGEHEQNLNLEEVVAKKELRVIPG